MEFDWTVVALWVIAIAGVGLGLYKVFIGGASVADTTKEIQGAMQVAQEAVAAAEQLWQSGQIEQDERFTWVLARLQTFYPALSATALEMTIEAAVYWLKQGVAKVEVDVESKG